MRKKLLVIVFVLLYAFSQDTAYGATPSALDIYNLIYPLQPGVNVQVAYDILGPSHEITERKGTIPPGLIWYPAPNRAIVVFLRNDSTLENCSYVEIYEEKEFARQRYEVLKGDFRSILGTPLQEFEWGTSWRVKNFTFAMDYEGPKMTISFFAQ